MDQTPLHRMSVGLTIRPAAARRLLARVQPHAEPGCVYCSCGSLEAGIGPETNRELRAKLEAKVSAERLTRIERAMIAEAEEGVGRRTTGRWRTTGRSEQWKASYARRGGGHPRLSVA